MRIISVLDPGRENRNLVRLIISRVLCVSEKYNIYKMYPQDEAGSPLMTKDDEERLWLTGLLNWDTDDLSHPPCRVTGQPSVFSDIASEERWLEEATGTRKL